MDPNVLLPKEIRFWTMAIPLVPSIICSLLVLHHYLFDRVQRNALNNHVFVVIIGIGLICQITTFPWNLYQYRLNDIWYRSPLFCEIWLFIDSGLFWTQMIFFAWASIERHILIFHDRLLRVKRWRILLHYVPLLAIFSYCMIWYGIVFFIPPCRNIYMDSDSFCVMPCLWTIYEFSMYESFVNTLIPNLLIVIFSFLLLVRVMWMKSRMRQTNQWRKHRKMAVQLFSIISAYLIFETPYLFNVLLFWLIGPTDVIMVLDVYFVFISYFPMVINPYICFLSSNELRAWFYTILRCRFRRFRAVAAVPLKMETKIKTSPLVA